MSYEDVKVDYDLLKKVLANNGNCLCKLNVKCPCPEFVNGRECTCGVYKTK